MTAAALISTAFAVAAPAPAAPDKKADGESEKSEGGKFEPFKPEAVTSTGSVTIGGSAISYQAVAGTLVVHPKDWDDVPRDPKAANSGAGEEGARQESERRCLDVLCRLFQKRRRFPACHLHLQRWARLGQLLAAHGGFWSAPYRHGHGWTHAGGALFPRQQCVESARCNRPRVHRRSGNRIQPHRGQGQGKGVLRRRSRCLCLR